MLLLLNIVHENVGSEKFEMNEIVKISLDIEIIYYLQKSFIINYND